MKHSDRGTNDHRPCGKDPWWNCLEELGIRLSTEQEELFRIFLRELKAWRKKVSLTSLSNDLDILVKHFVDSLHPLFLIPHLTSLVDFGSGAGFPSIPLKIANPTLRITMLESNSKKVFFMRHIIRSLHLLGIHGIQHRIGIDPPETLPFYPFDMAIARAFGPMEEILQLSKSYLTKGGKVILMLGKGMRFLHVHRICNALGFQLETQFVYSLPIYGYERNLFCLVWM